MRRVIVLSGEIRDFEACRFWLRGADRLLCADGGARHLRRMGVRPDLLVGDLDSISRKDRLWLDRLKVPTREYPRQKDETDSEIALEIALSDLSEPCGQHEIIILAAFGDRPDHVLANQMLAAQLARKGWRLILTDGISTLYTLAGGQKLTISQPLPERQPAVLSVIPIGGPVDGLTYSDGLLYPLTKAALPAGSTRGVSNRLLKSPVEISLDEGVAMVVVTGNFFT